MIDRIFEAMLPRIQRAVNSASARLARRAVRLIEAGDTRMVHVAQRLGVTPRHLRRVFKHSVGIGPKDFARTIRLHRAIEMTSELQDWGRIAQNAGYYDQSHLIADFHDLVGLSPGAFLGRPGARRCPTRHFGPGAISDEHA